MAVEQVRQVVSTRSHLALDFLSLEGWVAPFSLVWTAKTASSNSSHNTLSESL